MNLVDAARTGTKLTGLAGLLQTTIQSGVQETKQALAAAAAAPKTPTAPAPSTGGLGGRFPNMISQVVSRVRQARPASTGSYLTKQTAAILPRMHTGGPILKDGAYQLKAGEHVLTADEAAQVRKHVLLHAGLRSLAKTGK